MNVSSFFFSIVAFWAAICLMIVLAARLFANKNAAPSSDTATSSATHASAIDPVASRRVFVAAGESLSAARLTAVLIGVGAPLSMLWLHTNNAASRIHLLAGGALACAFLISLCHGWRRQVLEADTRGEQ